MFVLDRSEICVYAPVSGYVEVVYAEDVTLPSQMSYICDSFQVEINRPAGDTVVVDKSSISGGLSGLCSGRIQRPQTLVAGAAYRVPVFVLKMAGESYVFDSPGTYRLVFTILDIDPRSIAEATVEVLACDKRTAAVYLSMLPHGPAMMPFGNDQLLDRSDAVSEGPYLDALMRYSAYNQGGGPMGRLMHSPVFSMDYCASEAVAASLGWGRHWAGQIGCNEGFWDALSSRITMLLEGGGGSDERIDGNGIRWLGP